MVQSQALSAMTIGKLAASAGVGVGVETIRFYQRKGLIGTPSRDGGVRRYNGEDARRLRFIREAQAAGFTLAEIKELIELDSTAERARAHALATARIATLDRHIAQLKRARNSLKRLAEDCGSGSRGPCPILTSFGV